MFLWTLSSVMKQRSIRRKNSIVLSFENRDPWTKGVSMKVNICCNVTYYHRQFAVEDVKKNFFIPLLPKKIRFISNTSLSFNKSEPWSTLLSIQKFPSNAFKRLEEKVVRINPLYHAIFDHNILSTVCQIWSLTS